MNWRTFSALLAREAHVARRNMLPLLMQVLLQPLLFVFIFGKVMTTSGLMPAAYKSLLLPGIMALSMLLAGIQAVSMPLIVEFQFTREIEDRLLAPIGIGWIAVEKVVAGMVQALIAGLVVIPAGWVLIGRGVNLSFKQPFALAAVALAVALFSAAGGLALGCSVGQTQIGLMFSLILAPMIMFGCAYYPWSALATFPILQKVVLINPLVYASEGLRATLAPQFPHMPMAVILPVLIVVDAAVFVAGVLRFQKKALS